MYFFQISADIKLKAWINTWNISNLKNLFLLPRNFCYFLNDKSAWAAVVSYHSRTLLKHSWLGNDCQKYNDLKSVWTSYSSSRVFMLIKWWGTMVSDVAILFYDTRSNCVFKNTLKVLSVIFLINKTKQNYFRIIFHVSACLLYSVQSLSRSRVTTNVT